MRIEIPWPPSVNTYWRNVKGKTLLSAKGRAYQKTISDMAWLWPKYSKERLHVEVTAYPPDRRRRDLDNLPKAIFDSLEKAGVYADDEQIDFFSIERGEIKKPGLVVVRITTRSAGL